MAGVRLNVQDQRRIANFLRGLDPDLRRGVTDLSLRAIARRAEALAKTKYIVRGRGKRAPALPDRLTWRTGRLTRSISTDESRAPKRVVVGSSVAYAPIHELGGTVRRRGRTHKDGTPGVAHEARYGARPFLEPAAVEVLEREAAAIFRKQLRKLQRSA